MGCWTAYPKFRELTLSEALSDPLVRALMAADGVDARALASDMNRMARAMSSQAAQPRAPATLDQG